MKTFFLFIILALPLSAEPINLPRLRDAIAMRETGLHPERISRTGDIGPCQMAPITRKDGRDELGHLRWLEANLPKLGMPVSPYTIALSWRLGYGAIRDRRISNSAAAYAEDISRLYYLP